MNSQASELYGESALSRARTKILAPDHTAGQCRTLLYLCGATLEADGTRHVAEEGSPASIYSMLPTEH